MKKNFVIFPFLVWGFAALANAQAIPTKVAIIHVQNAILSTKDGKKAAKSTKSALRRTGGKAIRVIGARRGAFVSLWC